MSVDPAPVDPASVAPTSVDPTPAELLDRLSTLEARVDELESDRTGAPAPAVSTLTAAPGESPSENPFWALTSLKERLPAPGGVLLTGAVDVGAGHLEYQWSRPTEHLLETDWQQHAESVAALGHPLRMGILRRLLDGEHTVAQLVEELELGSTGIAYHHLSALQVGGWVHSPRRGSWSLPTPRVIPLLTILIALEKG
ncbi:helix-turn-helix transcriptional regulator [uncultured Brachybacterium sp.]|uniref:ArsR/SmtB family transcription factor n=1 Tax=uncultured Brachybacterium sp. TaxID=189680 RepID=UPI0026285A87|nr:helix-turn-helix domain-containing protein [uncultured Brachybacterium sp.]